MSLQGLLFNLDASVKDTSRLRKTPMPEGVSQCRNISYGSHGKWSLLDVYHPHNTTEPLPTIVSIHGGGYVYGTKEVYRYYGMDMASRGFAFVNFNYRLAPKWRFPTPLWDTNTVMEWICCNAARYYLDPKRIILIGDSAGAQLASQYAAIATNPGYAGQFHMSVPDINIRAVGLSCGFYKLEQMHNGPLPGLARDYLGPRTAAADPRLKVLPAITDQYPPSFVVTAHEDYLKAHAEPMYDHLICKGVNAEFKCYGCEGDTAVGHVFHTRIDHPEAIRCNDDAAAFFRQFV